MQIAIIVICCLMPCIGLVLGLLMLMKGKNKLTDGTKPGCRERCSCRLAV